MVSEYCCQKNSLIQFLVALVLYVLRCLYGEDLLRIELFHLFTDLEFFPMCQDLFVVVSL
jgi:hypothetical protein